MLNDFKKWLGNEKKDPTLFDIIMYGSSVKGKTLPEDIDLLVIFREGSLKERLQKLQELKKKIKTDKKIDIKSILWEELFDPAFFARTGVLLEGISIFDGKTIAQKLGFQGNVLFVYSLKEKTHTQKVKFNYVLSGRNGAGIVKKLEGKHLAPGVIMIPIRHALEFEDVLKLHDIRYQRFQVLVAT